MEKHDRICSIDIGTNSVLYLLTQIDNRNRIRVLTFKAKTTRLGESLRTKGILGLQAQKRTITSIKEFFKHAHQKGAIHYILSGTSALREAKNTSEFTQRLYQETGKHLIILTETQEAKLVFSAVKHSLGIKSGKAVIADIGGGSTELVFCHKGEPVKILSIPIGAVNLTERYRNNLAEMDKFTQCRIKKMVSYYTKQIKPVRLIGVGGTVTTLGAVLQKLKKYDPHKVHKHIVTKTQVIHTLIKLNHLNLKERRKALSFDPKRADIIVAGLVILKAVMDLLNIRKLKICDRGLVYGLAFNYWSSKTPAK